MNKSMLLAALSCLTIAIILYSAGAFIAADWDIRTWTTEGRVLIVFFWLAGSVASGLALVPHHADD